MPTIPTDISRFQAGSADSARAQAEAAKVRSLKDQKVSTPKEVEKAASGFEALLLQQMMKSMWEGMERTGFLGEDSNQAEIIRGMFSQAVADEVASGRGIGVKEAVKTEIAKRQGGIRKGE